MSCCSSSSITPCTVSVNDALSLLECTCNSCGSLCESSVATPMPPSPVPQFSSVIAVEDYLFPEGFFSILNFEASGASFSTVTNDGGGRCTINVDTQLVERRLWSDAINEINNNDLIPGKLYWIYDVGDATLDPPASPAAAYAGIVLKAIDVNKFDITGAYIARPVNVINASFWHNSGSYPQGSFVENMNYVYTNNVAQTTPPYALPPSANTTIWTRVPKDDNTKYVTEIYTCIYDILENQIYSITDTRNNTVTVTKDFGTGLNEIFLFCFRWNIGNNVYGNKITVNGLTSAYGGFFAGDYPNIARTFANRANFNFWNWPFYGNEIRLDIGKAQVGFNSVEYVLGQSYSSFYGAIPLSGFPQFNNNELYNCYTFVNENVNIKDNYFYDCDLGTKNGTIINTYSLYPFGILASCRFYRCKIFNNTGIFTRCEMKDCTISGNTEQTMVDIHGHIQIQNNTNCRFQIVTAHTRVTNASNYVSYNEISSNNDVFIEDVSGQFFTINSNTTISIRYNTTINNGYIRGNVGTATPILLDISGVNIEPVSPADARLSCAIQQVQIDNQGMIENNTWNTAGGIVRTKISGGEIRDVLFDFRDPVWAGGGAQSNPPAASDMQVGGVPVYLFQNRKKLPLYPHPSTIDSVTIGNFTYIDGTVLSTDTILPLLNAYIFSGGSYSQLPYISNAAAYANGSNMDSHGGEGYVFLNTEDLNVYNAATATLTLPAWTSHASIIYLYNKAAFTATIANISDSVSARTLYNFRIIVLSDGHVLNLTTTSALTATGNKIVSSTGPAPATITISNKFDVLELEKRNNVYYVSNYQKMA